MRYSTLNMPWPWKPGYGPSRSLKMSPFDRAHFLLTFHSNHGPISYRFPDWRRFQSKIAKFSHPLVFCAHAERVPLELSRMMGLPGRQRSLTITSAIWIECTNVTDRRTPGDCEDCACAYGKNVKWFRGISQRREATKSLLSALIDGHASMTVLHYESKTCFRPPFPPVA